ncbi:MAG: magnesium transporter [Acidobacteria bacterium]|nr:magnesium transporter [Acidobacteriota bacterium]
MLIVSALCRAAGAVRFGFVFPRGVVFSLKFLLAGLPLGSWGIPNRSAQFERDLLESIPVRPDRFFVYVILGKIMDNLEQERLQQLLVDDKEHAMERIRELPVPEIADLIRALPIEQAAGVVKELPIELSVEVFDEPTLRRRRELVKHLDTSLVAAIAERMSPDERADFFGNLEEEMRANLLRHLSKETQAELLELLAYPPATAGGLMTTEFVEVYPEQTVEEALAHIREVARHVETVYSAYAVDRGTGKLLGVLSLRDLLTAENAQPISEIMNPDTIAVNTGADQEEVARLISMYNFLAVPVVDDAHRILGIVTVDDVLDVVSEEQSEDLQRISGMEPLENPYFRVTPLAMVRKRASWLVAIFIGELFTGTALRHYDSAIAAARMLVFFVPLIISSGGNSGSQSATLVVRGLATGEITLRQWLKVLGRELLVGSMLGIILGAVAFGRALMWGNGLLVAFAVASTLLAVVTMGTLVGAMLPIFFKRVGFDPAVSSTPFIATLVDVSGIIIYFNIARSVLHL